MLLFIPLLLLGMGGIFLPAASDMKEYYVTPTPAPNPDCPPGKECHTLYEYARDNSSYFGNQTNATLIFLSGVHNLNRSLYIKEMNQLILTGEKVVSNLENPEVIVDCAECNITLYDMQEISIQVLSLSFSTKQFAGFTIEKVNYFTQRNTSINLKTYIIFYRVTSVDIFQSEYINGTMEISELPERMQMSIMECKLTCLEILFSYDRPGGILDINIKETNIVSGVPSGVPSLGWLAVVRRDALSVVIGHITLVITQCNISSDSYSIYFLTAGYLVPKSDIDVMIEDTSFRDSQFPITLYGGFNTPNIVVIIKKCEMLQTNTAVAILADGSNIQLTIQDSLIGYASHTGVHMSFGGSQMLELTIQGTTISNCLTALELHQNSANSSLTMRLQDSEIINSSRGLGMANQGETGQNYISITNSKISNCEIALQLLVDSNSSLTMKVQDSELVNSSHGISVVNRGESWQTDITIINSIISNSRESGIEFPKPDVQNQLPKEGGNLRMKVLDSMIVKNQGRGLYINVPANTNFELVIENSVIANTSGISLEAYGDSDFNRQQNLILDLRNVSFVNNRDTSSTELTTIKVAGISNKVLVHDCLFQGNLGTPIKMILGELYISGMTKFSNNEGLQGGALSLIFSKVYFANNTEVVLENNIALDTGGAIYVQYVEDFDSCFYQLPYLSGEHGIDTQLTFTNNKAGTGGDDFYGAVLRSNCSITADVEGLTVTSNSVYDKIFRFTNSSRSSLAPASMRVSLCSPDNEPVCDSSLRYILVLILLFYLCYLISRCVKWKRNHHSKGQPVLRLRQHKSDLRNDDYGGRCCIL